MMFSSNTFRFTLVLAAACNAVSSAFPNIRGLSQTSPNWVDIGTAGNYVILTKTGISTVPISAITGDIAVSPIAATAITGFSLVADSGGKYSKSSQLTGRAFAADYAVPTPTQLTTAVGDMGTAYLNAEGLENTDATMKNIGGGVLDNVTLTSGIYTFDSNVTINDTIYFDGNDSDVFTIQIAGNLEQVRDTQVILTNGALANNFF
jgi:hypothetical protein